MLPGRSLSSAISSATRTGVGGRGTGSPAAPRSSACESPRRKPSSADPATFLGRLPAPRVAGSAGAARPRSRATSPPATDEQREEPLPGAQQLELEEVAHRLGGEDQREERPEPRDHRQHVALDRDVLAARAALEQQDEAEPEHDQRRRRGRPALLERAAEDRVDEEEGEQRPGADRDPGRDRERRQRAQQPPAVERPLARREREDERRDADRQERGERQLAGQEREREAEDRRRQRSGTRRRRSSSV